jgi:hypothetical protein
MDKIPEDDVIGNEFLKSKIRKIDSSNEIYV